MQIKSFHQSDLKEDHVDVYYRKATPRIQEILAYLRKHEDQLYGMKEDRKIAFSIHDVFYFESVDKRTFAYLQDDILRMDLRLQELEELFHDAGFIRVNKSTILNIYKIKELTSDFNMRIVAILENEEKIQINRSYKAKFNQFLKEMEEKRSTQ